jgi:hypothetical protein
LKRHARIVALALILLASLPPCALAQTPPAKPKKPATTTVAPPRVELDPLAEIQRNVAISLLTSLADEARSFRDPVLRARVQVKAADALWETDVERARALFRRAWEAASTADDESQRRFDEELRARRAARGGGAMALNIRLTNLRGEVLRLAARRELALGEEFLTQMDEARKQESSTTTTTTPAGQQASAPPPPPPTRALSETPAAVRKRLDLAEQVLADGDAERALQFADPALTSANLHTLSFLAKLRVKNPSAADQRYAALLGGAANDPASDANTASLLTSYLFTPHLYVTFNTSGGSNQMQTGDPITPPASSTPQLRAAFFQTAAAILLRPLPPPEQDRTSAGRAGTYMVIARLLPLFEQHAPAHAPALQSKLAALQSDTPERNRQPDNRALTNGLVPEDSAGDRVQEQLDRLEQAKTPAERDDIYVNAALNAVNQKDARAGELADKIEDLDLRKQVRAFIAFDALRKATREKDGAEVLRRARAVELTPIQRTWGITEAARMLRETDAGRAIEALDDALVEARRIDQAAPERARALVAIVTQLFRLDKGRAWEAMSEMVKAANAAEGFTGSDGELPSTIESKNMIVTTSSYAETFDLRGIFNALANDDLNRAVSIAKTLNGESARATATLAVATAILDKKRK